MEWLSDILHAHNGLMLFLVLGFGYLIGKIGAGGFSLGPVAGVLFAGIVFGHFGYRINPGAQAVGFAFFIFTVGYQAGPAIVQVLRRDGTRYLLLALLISAMGLFAAVGFSTLLSLPAGMPAGLLAGGLTSSPTLAAAQEAVMGGNVALPEGVDASAVVDNIATTYAITYIFGLTGLIIMIKMIPKIFRINYVSETVALQAMLASGERHETPVGVRAYRVESSEFLDADAGTLRQRYWDGRTVFKVYRNGTRLRLADDERFERGDELWMIGPRDYLIETGKRVGSELSIDSMERNDLNLETASIVVSTAMPLTAGALALEYGLVLLALSRKGEAVEFDSQTVVLPNDVLMVMGPSQEIETAGAHLGYLERERPETDMLTFVFGIAAGIVIGTLGVTLGGVTLGLGGAGGLLVSGLLIGYWRSVRPTFGRMPEATRWFLMEFGLLLFMAGVGLRAGGSFVETLSHSGVLLILAGVAVTLIPLTAGYLFGRYVLRLNPVLLLGALAGGMTSGAALSVVLKEAKSPLPALGYTGTYAIANILLVIAGSLIFMFT